MMAVKLFSFLNPPPPPPFSAPAMYCGQYDVSSPAITYGEVLHFTLRRIPRQAKHLGKFGLFWHSADEGVVLIALYSPTTGGFDRVDDIPAHTYPFRAWLGCAVDLVVRTCAWCGRRMGDEDGVIHAKCVHKIK